MPEKDITGQIINNNTYLDYSDCKNCEEGKKFCLRACWPLPKEAKKIIETGLGNKLMLDYWVAENPIYILCPATPGFEGKDAPAPENPWEYLDIIVGIEKDPLNSGCTFQDKVTGFCNLHDLGLKPAEGRKTCCKIKPKDLHRDIAMAWDSSEGKEIVIAWKKLYYKK